MRDNKKDFAISGYSHETEVVTGFTTFIQVIFENLKTFAIRMQDKQVKTRRPLIENCELQNQVHQESIKLHPLEQLIKMGFNHF